MTEYSLFWTTSGNGDGVVTGYSPEQFWRLFRALFGGDGVALDYGSELETTLAGGVATVAAGAALVAGVPYTNDADADVTIADPTDQNRRDRIVLRASWPAQTVRAVQLTGTEGSGALPVLTQTQGGIYEVEVARVVAGAERVLSADLTVSTTLLVETLEVGDGYALEVAAGGVVTLEDTSITDARTFLQAAAPGSVTATQLADGAVSGDILTDGAATNAKLADMAESTVKGRAVGAGTGDPADLSASQVVDILETADGAGSGLDADLLDGEHAAALAVSGHTHGGYSALSHTHSGYASASHTHSTYAAAGHSHVGYAAATHSHSATDLPDNGATNAKLADMAQATVKGRAYGTGSGDPVDLTAAQVIDILETVDGHGSGLDADTLDTYSSAAFATDDHTHSTPSVSSHGISVAGASGTIYQATWNNVAMLSGSITISAVYSPTYLLTLSGYTSPTPVVGTYSVQGVTSTGKPFQIQISGGTVYIYCQDDLAIGDVYEFTVVYLT